jgi:H+/Cl- antiporter ClcA
MSTNPDGAAAGGAEQAETEQKVKGGWGTAILIALVALPLGVAVLYALQELIHLIWVEAVPTLEGPALWVVVLASTTIAGVLVAIIRKHRNGHNPLSGIATVPVYLTDYPAVMGAILVTLVGGLVLGPEVALVTTGSLVGSEFGRRRGDIEQSKAMMVGIGFAVLALFVEPMLTGSFEVATSYEFTPIDIVGTVCIAVVTAVVLMAGRWAAIGLIRIRGGDTPAVIPMAVVGLLVGLIALAYTEATGNPLSLVLTSGETDIKPLVALGTASAIGLAVAAKWLAYSLSLGGGFRGGPYFPALFIGAGVGAMAVDIFPSLSAGSAAAGIAAAFSYLAHGSWKATAVLGIVLGVIVGGGQAILICLLAVAIGKLVPAVNYASTASAAPPAGAPASTASA